MQEKIINHFISLTKVPHCSQNTEVMFQFLTKFAKNHGYTVKSDEKKNILISKGKAKLALQAHYDMVCMGNAPKIETYIEEGWLYARESSLGADNGIAIAMMMSLMEEGIELEFVLTADEEVGLVGAGAIELELTSKYMLNIDFEDEGIVCIGCAGGADLLARKSFDEVNSYEYSYEVSVLGLDGGHSGVDIDKNIPSAIKVLANYLSDKEVLIASCHGGERRNSISANVTMKLSSKKPLVGNHWVDVQALDESLKVYNSSDFLNLLIDFKQGIHDFNDEFNLADTSVNLAIINFKNGEAKIECSSRGMNDDGLHEINETTRKLFEKYGFENSMEYKYPAWKPEVNEFTASVNDAMVNVFGESKYEAIHAGLECGVLLERYPTMKFASIGPTIIYPHSTREGVKLDSVGKIFKVVEEVISTL